MKCVVAAIFVYILVVKVDCGANYIRNNLEYYKFHPKLGDCYDVYEPTETITPFICQRPSNPGRRSCIEQQLDKENCLVLRTPSNETIQFMCQESVEISNQKENETNTCFNVLQPESTTEKICQRVFDKYSVGLTTPKNFTILFHSVFCTTVFTKEDATDYAKFLKKFSFDNYERNCYKIFNQNQKVSPYACFSEDVYETCVEDGTINEQRSKGNGSDESDETNVRSVKGIKTQNNETVLIPKDGKYIHVWTSDGKKHTSYRKAIEERCMGYTTPSNLTILVDCIFCSKPHVKYLPYPRPTLRNAGFPVAQLSQDIAGQIEHSRKSKFRILKRNGHKSLTEYSGESKVDGKWLLNETCYGFTLDNNETVILECLSNHTQHILKGIKYGCYPVVNLGDGIENKQIVCSKIVDELSMGLTTPLNWTVVLSTFYDDYRYKNIAGGHGIGINEEEANEEVQDTMFRFKQNEFPLQEKHIVKVYEPGQRLLMVDCHNVVRKYPIHKLPGHEKCLGLLLDSLETVVFTCANKIPEKPGCYDVFEPTLDENDYIVPEKVANVCVKELDFWCVGITTPKNWTIALSCYHLPGGVCSLFGVPSRKPPPRS